LRELVTPVFGGKVSETGKLELWRRDLFEAHLNKLRGKFIRLILEPRKTKRSNNQNRYYWGVVVAMLAEEIGYTRDQMHDALRLKFLRVEADLEYTRSTTELSTKEFEAYLDDVRIWAATDLGTVIPLPNEVAY